MIMIGTITLGRVFNSFPLLAIKMKTHSFPTCYFPWKVSGASSISGERDFHQDCAAGLDDLEANPPLTSHCCPNFNKPLQLLFTAKTRNWRLSYMINVKYLLIIGCILTICKSSLGVTCTYCNLHKTHG